MKTGKRGTGRSRIKKGDTVVFIAGREYNRYDANGKRKPLSGAVVAVNPREGKVKVEGAMIMKRHTRANPQINKEGGIIKIESWVDISNVALLDPETGKPTRVRYEVRDGKKVRVAKSGKLIGEKIKTEKTGKTERAEKPEKKTAEKKSAKKAAKED